MRNITVLSPPYKCVACDTVKNKLKTEGFEFESAPVEEHPDILAEAKSAGMLSFPLVIVTDEEGNREDLFAGPSKSLEHISKWRKERKELAEAV